MIKCGTLVREEISEYPESAGTIFYYISGNEKWVEFVSKPRLSPYPLTITQQKLIRGLYHLFYGSEADYNQKLFEKEYSCDFTKND